MKARTLGGWYGFRLDGVLAHHDGYKGRMFIGSPVPLMVDYAKRLRENGIGIKIVTSRVRVNPNDSRSVEAVRESRGAIKDWCRKYLGFVPEITSHYDERMICCYECRAVQVEKNTGMFIGSDFPFRPIE